MSGIDIRKRYVRVTGVTPNGFVEFEFSIADRTLCVELLLPQAAFAGFCETNGVEFVGIGEPRSLRIGQGALSDAHISKQHGGGV
jgi:hypothetical protein